MITQEEAEHLTCEEAAKLPRSLEIEDDETLGIIVGKALIYLAAKDEFEILVDEKGKFFFRENRSKNLYST